MRIGVLTRYLLRAHLGPFLFALSAITGLIFLNAVTRNIDGLVGKGLPWTALAEFLVLSLPHTIALSLPMSVLVAVLYVFSELTEHNEVMAMSASGVSPTRVLVPLVALGVVATGVMLYFNDSILPEANHRLKNLLVDIGRKSPTLDLREQVVNEIRTGDGQGTYFLTADRIDPTSNTLDDVSIVDRNNMARQRITHAARGVMAFNDTHTDLYLTLYDGEVLELQADREGGFQRLYFGKQVVPMRGVGDEFERQLGGVDRGDREMDFAMLRERAEARETDLADLQESSQQRAVETVRGALGLHQPDSTGIDPYAGFPAAFSVGGSILSQDGPTREIVVLARSNETRARSLQELASRYRVELHKKLAIAFACLVFAIMGPPLALRFPRGGVGMVVAASTVIFAIYWMGLIGGEALADRRVTGPVIAMWIPNIVFLVIALLLVSRMGRAGSTVRGGSWDELLYKLRGALSGRGIGKREAVPT